MSEGLRIETAQNTPSGATAAPGRAPREPRERGTSRPLVFGMSRSTTALLAIVMALIFTLQVLALSQGQSGAARWLTIAIAGGSGVLALLYFVVAIRGPNQDDD